MSSKIEMLGNNRAKISLHIPAERFEEGMNFSYNKNKSQIKLPGFRAGKVPRLIAEKQFGPEIFLDDAINYCFPDAYEQAKEELNLEAVSRPELDVSDYDKEKGIELELTVWLKPEVKLGDYKGLIYDDVDIDVTEEDVQTVIDEEREKNSRELSISDRPVQNGDITVINFEGFIDGEAFDGGTASNYKLVIGSKSFIDTFEEQLIGKNIGDETEVCVKFPDDYGKEELRGKNAVFKVRINEIIVKELPDADDEFAQDVSEHDTFDEYKNAVKEKLIFQKEQEKDLKIEEQLLDSVIQNAECDVPPVMIENQIEKMVQEVSNRFAGQGIPLDSFLQYSGQTMESFKEGYRETAEQNVKARLILGAVAKIENIEPTQEEIDAEITKMAESYGFEEEKVREFLRKDDIKGLSEDLKTQKAMALVKENAVKKN